MEKKVLVIGPNYFNYLKASAESFKKHGYAVTIDAYDTPIHPYTAVMKLRYKICRNKKLLKAKRISCYNRHIVELFNRIKPDIVFIMNGEILTGCTLDHMRRDAKVVVWLYDNLEKLTGSAYHLDHVDLLCSFEQDDVEYLSKMGNNVRFLPQACDTSTYYPIQKEKNIDISFVGHIFYSPKRRATIDAVIERFPDKKIVVYGLYMPWYKGFWKWLTRKNRKVYKNRMIPADKVNELYNKSKVVLNIHQESQKQGANPRTFEIIGSGAYQICDSNPYIEELFTDGEIGVYHNYEELFNLIEEGLNTDKSVTIAKARKYVLENHSFDRRIEKVLEWIETETN